AHIAINQHVITQLKQWLRQWRVLDQQIRDTRRSWQYPTAYKSRKSIARDLAAHQQKLRAHELSLPTLLDFQNNEYAKQLQNEIRQY
ncbi:hypothetical protein, partial [Pseudomonas cannabina]|uniref:hypothetical protein n=1 Tax=Pseudomonas cannabina TaxID=86840 RepID=UPI000B1CB54B